MRNEVSRCRHLDNVDWQFNGSCLPQMRYPMIVSILSYHNGVYNMEILKRGDLARRPARALSTQPPRTNAD